MPEDSPSIYTIMAERVANAILGKINALIGSHNTNTQAHQDIRDSIPKIFYATCDCSEQDTFMMFECEDWIAEHGNVIYVNFYNVNDNVNVSHGLPVNILFINEEDTITVHNTMYENGDGHLILFRDTVVKFTYYYINQDDTAIFLYEFPTLTSELYNDSGFITSSSVPNASSTVPSADTINGGVGTGTAWARSDHTHPKSSLYEDNTNKVTSLSSSSTDTQYPSAKAVYDAVENTFNLDTLDCINENFTLLSLPQIILTYNKSSLDGAGINILNTYTEGTYVDWGDGTPIETYESTNTLEHDYSDNVQEHTITIYGNILNLYNNSFKNLTGMTSINIPSNVTSLGDYCFYGCTNLTNITIPNSVTSLGKSCLSLCTGLTNITIPSNVTSLEKSCFSGCSNLTNITIPNSVTSLGTYCFSSCTRLTSITIPSSVTKLLDHCFYYCTGLTSVTIPSSVTSLGVYCFSGCTNLVDYQLYWETPPATWSSSVMPNNADTYFTIPNGTTANYTAKSYPVEKLVERSE